MQYSLLVLEKGRHVQTPVSCKAIVDDVFMLDFDQSGSTSPWVGQWRSSLCMVEVDLTHLSLFKSCTVVWMAHQETFAEPAEVPITVFLVEFEVF